MTTYRTQRGNIVVIPEVYLAPGVTPVDVISPIELESILDTLGVGYEPSERNRKRLYWREDMENYTTPKWYPTIDEVITYINTTRAFEGDYVLSMQSPTITNISANAYFGAIKPGIHAVELRWWKAPATAQVWGLRFYNSGPVTTDAYIAEALWQESAGPGWTYTAENGSETRIPTNLGLENIYDNLWNYLYLEADFQNNIYRRLKSNHLDVDLSSLNLPLYHATGWPRGRFGINLIATTNAPATPVYFDDVRLYLDVE